MILIDIYFNEELESGEAEVILFSLLSERKPEQSISHKKMPTFEQHKKFVKSRPYKDWYLIWENMDEDAIGSIYLSENNEIGIFIFEDSQYKGYGKQAIKLLMKIHKYVECFYANISPANTKSIAFFNNFMFEYDYSKAEGGIEIQRTYIGVNPYYVKRPS